VDNVVHSFTQQNQGHIVTLIQTPRHRPHTGETFQAVSGHGGALPAVWDQRRGEILTLCRCDGLPVGILIMRGENWG
jgi:hypothetical protein